MRSHLHKDHVDTKHCIVYTPPEAASEKFYIQLQMIPQKARQRRRRNSGIDEGTHALWKTNSMTR